MRTIPTGYPERLSAAVEAVASSGGQIMPPIMGAGAFVMVELTGIPYTHVLTAVFLPALLYFFAVWIGINAFSRRWDLKPVPVAMIANPAIVDPAGLPVLTLIATAKIAGGLILTSRGIITPGSWWLRGGLIGAGLTAILLPI